MKKKMYKMAVVIPTYNEKDNLKKIIPIIFSILPKIDLIIVDDNSPDKSAMIVRKLKKRYKNLHLIERLSKSGRGSAVIEGFRYAFKKINADLYIEMDADFSHDPQELPNLIKFSKPKKIVVASRYLKESKILGWSLLHKIVSKFSNILIRMLLKIPLEDNTNGYRCYRKDSVKELLKYSFKNKGYFLLSECSYLLLRKGFDFKEVQTVFYKRQFGKSKTDLAEFINSFFGLIKISKMEAKIIF